MSDKAENQNAVQSEKPLTPAIETELKSYTQHIDALHETLPLLMLILFGHKGATKDSFNTFLHANGTPTDESKQAFVLKPSDIPQANRLQRKCTHAGVVFDALPRTMLVALVSEFDFFIGRLIRCLFYLRPEKLNDSEKQMSFLELFRFKSIDEAREAVIDKEIESVLRSSHADQISWLEKKFEVTLTKDLHIWSDFIEITERRNLFVHCNGVVSSQYRVVCKKHGLSDKSLPAVGDILWVDDKYFRNAYSCFYEMGVKLAHVLWRVVNPDDRDRADASYNMVLFDLICEEQYRIASVLAEFYLKYLKRSQSKDITTRMVIINLAQAYKWSGDNSKAQSVVSDYDWSSCGDLFQMAIQILGDRYEDAASAMIRVGKSEIIGERDFQSWPIFKEFSKTESFRRAYHEVYSHPFSPIEVAPLADTLQETKSLKEFAQNLVLHYDVDGEFINSYVI